MNGLLGYVRAYKPELKCREYDVYKGVYCTLCKTLLRRYSPFGQLFLSYDAAFFALMLFVVSPQCPTMRDSRCCYNPVKKCLSCGKSVQMDFCADVSVLLYYYQILDHLHDKDFAKKLASALLFPIAWILYRKASRLQPRANEIIHEMMRKQAQAESDPFCSLDAAADPSASALQQLAALHSTDVEFGRIFYLLGRFVYLIDAVDDVRKDVDRGNFNPLGALYRSSPATFADQAMEKLNLTIAQMLQSFDSISWNGLSPIIQNVILDGLYNTALFVTKQYRTGQEAQA